MESFADKLAVVTGGGTLVQFSLRSTPNAHFSIDLFANAAADSSGFGEGAGYLTTAVVNTDSAGNATGIANVGTISAGQIISATATSASGDTSEFSHGLVVAASDRFVGLSRIERQRLVNNALADLLSSRIHALEIRARAPGEGHGPL